LILGLTQVVNIPLWINNVIKPKCIQFGVKKRNIISTKNEFVCHNRKAVLLKKTTSKSDNYTQDYLLIRIPILYLIQLIEKFS